MPVCRILTMLRSLGLFALVTCAIALVWYGVGRPVPMPPSTVATGHKITCVSFAPFHGDTAACTWALHIPDKQIASDLKTLSQTTACIRTYSARGAQGRVARLGGALGLQGVQGLWLVRNIAEH